MTAVINITPMGTLVTAGNSGQAQLLRPVGRAKNLSLTTASATTTLPAAANSGDKVVAYRVVALSAPCYVRTGSSTIAAVAGDMVIPQNGEVYLPAQPSLTHIAGIDA
jgi:hypothetical protein